MDAKSKPPKIPKGYHELKGSERPRTADAKLRGPAEAQEQVSVTLILRHKPGSPALPDQAHWQNTPLSQRRYLSPEEYAETYGAAQSDMDAVVAFIKAHGMTVLESHAGRRTVSVTGTAAQMNAAFGIQLNRYESPRPRPPRHTHAAVAEETPAAPQVHLGFDGPVHVPTELADIVIAVVGLDNRVLGGPGGSSGDPPNSNQLAVPTAARYYNFPNSGAADQTIGVIAPSDPPGTSGRRVSAYLPNDINNNYFPNLTDSSYRTTPASLNDISLTVGTNTYSNSAAAVQAITSANLSSGTNSFILEVTQDISTAATIAQGATVNVYFTEITEQGLLVCLNRILLPPVGENQPTVVTCSFYFWSSDDSGSIGSVSDTGSAAHLVSSLFQQLALLGISVFIIAGDLGSDDKVKDGGTHVNYPGSDPWVTCCGGTVIGNVKTGPPLTFEEFVWSNVGSSSQVGGVPGVTGGGASASFPIPAYQTSAGINSITDSKGNKSSNRFIPDVAGMVAYGGDPTKSLPNDWFYVNGLSYNFVGTSCITPLYAGLAAVIRSAFGVALGFLNPIFYQLGNNACNDITSGNNDPSDGSNAPYYTAGPGWDPCTGWGSIDGTKLLNGIAGLMYNQTFYFQVDKNSYGLDEVGVVSSYNPAFWLVLEGFTPSAALGITPTVSGAFAALSNVTVTVGAGQPEIKSQPNTPQRILYPCSVAFGKQAINTVAKGGVFPAPGSGPFSLPLTALITIGGQIFGAAAVFELIAGADPYFSNFNPQANNVFYLSQDLRVFTVTPGINSAPIGGVRLAPSDNTNYDSGAGFNYIQALLNWLNANHSDATGPDVFTLFPDQTSALSGDSSVTPGSIDPADPLGTPFANYNFAVARVRLNGPANTSSVKNVRVFFRMFATETNDTDYQTDWTYPSNLVGGFPNSPVLGTGDPPVTIPFFATGNYDSNSDHAVNVDYSANSVNNQPIAIGSSSQAWAYYGCYLNIYPTSNTINGQSVQSRLPGSHHCLVAQIAFDDAPIVNSNGTTENPENSDKLAQRNLQITYSHNPGSPATHRIPQTFDLRWSAALSSVTGELLDYPDELMIDWGNTPVGSTAQIYWPQVNSADVLALAKKLYSTHQLSAADANTVRCQVAHGFTYVPVPPGMGENIAGLFTVDLPPGIVAGQVFTVVVRRIATRTPPPQITERVAIEARKPIKEMLNWRYVIGTFAVRIPVTTRNIMLPLEENTLAIMKWRLGEMSPSNRWYPVLLRYISYIAGRVQGLGGDPSQILPSPTGDGRRKPICYEEPERRLAFTGKISGLIFDRFGDFEGFLLDTEEGERKFFSREKEIKELAERAWWERLRLTVWVECDELHRPLFIIIRQPPAPFGPLRD